MRIKESFEVHETLNPKLWDDMNKLKPEVREKILEIVNAFEEYLDYPIKILDVHLVGSNASYNWTEHSDLDVHIIANYEEVTDEPSLLQALYDSKKSKFNNDYNITIHGIEIEMYVQDVNSGITSNGIYSVCDDEWVKEPKPIKSITKHNTEKELEKWELKINEVINNNSYEEIDDTINMLYLMRHNSLAIDGEYGKGNQLFKDIRNKGLLDKLKDAKVKSQSKELSLENLNKGQLVQRIG